MKMSSENSPQVQTELDSLKKDLNEYLTTELHFILQPDYRKKNKARQLLDTLLKLVGPIEHVLEKPELVHDTLLDDGLQQQKSLMAQLAKDYPQPDNHAAFEDAQTHLKTIYALIKQLRQDVPKSSS
jgi:hypothetical protein